MIWFYYQSILKVSGCLRLMLRRQTLLLNLELYKQNFPSSDNKSRSYRIFGIRNWPKSAIKLTCWQDFYNILWIICLDKIRKVSWYWCFKTDYFSFIRSIISFVISLCQYIHVNLQLTFCLNYYKSHYIALNLKPKTSARDIHYHFMNKGLWTTVYAYKTILSAK